MSPLVSTEELLYAYANGFFPMAERRDSEELFWFHPEQRGVLPLERFYIPRRLAKTIKQKPYRITADTAFSDVIAACAAPRKRERDSWINPHIITLYTGLHHQGYAHSIETWEEGRLVGGLYGVSLGGAFFGESMFSRATDASKIALVALIAILRDVGYALLDTQYVNDHLKQFGVEEIFRDDYMARLRYALQISPSPSSRFMASSGRILRTLSSE